jgi:hypothetical protein
MYNIGSHPTPLSERGPMLDPKFSKKPLNFSTPYHRLFSHPISRGRGYWDPLSRRLINVDPLYMLGELSLVFGILFIQSYSKNTLISQFPLKTLKLQLEIWAHMGREQLNSPWSQKGLPPLFLFSRVEVIKWTPFLNFLEYFTLEFSSENNPLPRENWNGGGEGGRGVGYSL